MSDRVIRLKSAVRRHETFHTTIQGRLAKSIWKGCKTWYIDANGRSTTNWPGFATSYRLLTKRGSLDAYQFSHSPEGPAGSL